MSAGDNYKCTPYAEREDVGIGSSDSQDIDEAEDMLL